MLLYAECVVVEMTVDHEKRPLREGLRLLEVAPLEMSVEVQTVLRVKESHHDLDLHALQNRQQRPVPSELLETRLLALWQGVVEGKYPRCKLDLHALKMSRRQTVMSEPLETRLLEVQGVLGGKYS